MSKRFSDQPTLTSEDPSANDILREVARSPARRPPTTAGPGTRWGAGERYVIKHEIGRGGMGTVLAATDTVLGRVVALKILDVSEEGSQTYAHTRVLREARVAARVEHERIARVYDVGAHDGYDFVAMEYVRGVTLRARLKERALEPAEIATIATQIAEGLVVLHGYGIVHGDLKPENIMLTDDGGLKLLDFGLAREAPVDAAPASSRAIGGTPGYMSPEQQRGERIDPRADVFALGVILTELVTGERPGGADKRWALVPRALRDEALRMMAADAGERHADGAAVLAALRACFTPRRSWTKRVAIGIGVLVIAGAAVSLGRWIAHRRLLAAPPPPGMALVNAGTITMGRTAAEVDAQCAEIGPACDRARLELQVPARRVTVPAFYMDVREVSNEEMVALLNEVRGLIYVAKDEDDQSLRYVMFNKGLGHDGELLLDLYDLTSGITFAANSEFPRPPFHTRPGRERWPVTQVTLFGARYYCKSRGKRLPTEEEWEAAARGASDRKFPWGNEPLRCGGAVLAPDGKIPSEPGCPPTPTPRDVGTSPQDVTPDGIRDLGGNVGEWTDTVIGGDSATAGSDVPRVTRGGSYFISLAARTSVRHKQPPIGVGPNGGFRCAQNLE